MEGAFAQVERSFRTVKVARKRREGCAQSVPKRSAFSPETWPNRESATPAQGAKRLQTPQSATARHPPQNPVEVQVLSSASLRRAGFRAVSSAASPQSVHKGASAAAGPSA
jgi:hypothetical protein